ncbi:unnamed protein product [Rotaria magnacalcarata]|uniref:EGF-like domain-containing protein n=1 Tax=Rotaria magnacalcarata TaxID=392030 RepID=A0A819FRN8_9BILA|nr:unnamed protein product [Rotaria magnacalcarata]
MLQAMLSYGKYQTSQMPSNISYTSRYYGLNFLAYSPIDDLLIFIEPKHQIHIYNGHTIQLIANVNTTDVVSATSCASLLSESQHELFFIYETNTESNLISLRVCEVQFDIPNLKFEENICIGTIIVQYDQPDLRLNSFTIKRDHAETNKSLLFISTDIGLVYAVFETNTGVLVNEPTIMNETLNEGSVVVSSDGSVYYASKQEHLIYELHITKDFRLNFGQIIKANGIKHPFGLITDECNHLYIATRSMILVMSLKTFSTIRSVFSKASDLPITLERLNSTTYVYATIRANAKKLPSYWMFNFLYFTEGEKIFLTTRQPAVNQEEDFNSADITADDISMPILWPLSYFLPSETNKTKKYTQFFSTARKSSSESRKSNRSQKKKHNSIDSEISAISKEDLLTQNTPTVPSAPDLSDSNRSKNSDPDHKLIGNTQHDSHQKLNKSLQNNVHSETYLLQNTSFDSQSFSKHTTESSISDDDLRARIEKEKNLSIHTNNHSRDYTSKRPLTDSNLANVTTEAKERPFSDDDLQAFIEGRANFSKTQETQIKAYLGKQSLLNRSIASQFTTSTKTPISDTNALDHTTNTDTTVFSDDDLQSFLEGRGNFSKEREIQIKDYLSKQSSSNRDLISKYSTSTRLPGRISTTGDSIHSGRKTENTYSQKYPTEISVIDSKSLNRTADTEGIIFSDDDLRSYREGRGNLSKEREMQIQAYLSKRSSSSPNIFSRYSIGTVPPGHIYTTDHMHENTTTPQVNSENIQRFTDSDGISISHDDLQSYLQGRGNLSLAKQKLIQAYLAEQSASNRSTTSQHVNSSKNLPTTKHIPHETDSQDYHSQMPFSVLENIDRTIDKEEIYFSDEDIQSFLKSRGNLSKKQEEQIRTYLNKQSLSNKTTSVSTFAQSTKLPAEPETMDNNIYTDPLSKNTLAKDNVTKKPLFDLDHLKSTIEDDELRLYLEGRSNMSKSRIAQIEAYLNKQSSLKQNIFSSNSTSTKAPTALYTSTENVYVDHKSQLALIPDNLTRKPSSELENFNALLDSEDKSFSNDELRSFLEGRANFSKKKEAQIEVYLNKQSSRYPNEFSTYPTSGKTPAESDKLAHEKHSEYQSEDTHLQNYSTKTPLSDPKLFNQTIDSQAIIFTDDDLQSFLEGRANLSKIQKTHIETYLSQTSPVNRSITVKNPTHKKLPVNIHPIDGKAHANDRSEHTQEQELDSKKTLSDSKDTSRTVDTDHIVFTEDDLRSFLEGRSNLSQNQKAKIQSYLNKQSTSQTTNIKVPDERVNSLHGNNNTQFRDNSRTTPLPSWKDFRRTIDTQGITFTDNDLRSFLQDHVNLSQDQKIQIEAYLRKQSSANQSIFSNYQTSLKPPVKTSTSEDNVEPHDEGKETESQRIMFSDDELRSFLEGRANLSKKKKEKIEIYLNHQSLSNQSSFSRSSTIAKVPIGINPSNNKVDHYDENARTYSGNYLTTIRPSDSKDSSASTASESIIFSDDDVQSYLQGRSNLSSIQETQIQAYLAKQTSSNGSVFSRYFTSTGKPTPHDESWIVPDRLTNISLRDPQGSLHPGSLPKIDFNSTSRRVTPSKSISQNLSSMKPFTNSPTTILQRPWQSTGNQTHDLSKSIEKRQNISSDSNYDNNLQIDTFNEHSQLLKSTTNPSSDDHDEYYDTENKEKPFDSSEDDSNQLSSWPTHSTVSMNTDEAKEILTTIFSDEKSKIDKSMHRLSTISLSERLTRDKSNIHDSSILKDHNLVTKPNGIHTDKGSTLHFTNSNEQAIVQEDDVYVNLSISITKFESKPHSTFSSVTPYELTATKIKNFSADETARFRTKYPVDIKTNRTPSESLVHSDVNTTHIDKISLVTNQSGIHFPVNKNQIFSPKISNSSILQSQSIINDTSNTFDTPRHDLDDESKSIQDEIIHHEQTSTNATLMTNQTLISNVTSGYFNQNFKDEMKHESSSAVSVGVNVSSTLRILLPFIISSTTLLSSHRSPLSSPLHHSPAYTSSTRFTKSTLLSSSKLFSGTSTVIRKKVTTTTTTTTRPSYPADFTSSIHILQASNKHSNIQTTDSATTSVIVPSKLMTTPSLLITSEPYLTSTISSALFLKTNKQSTSTTVFDTYTTSQLESSSSSSYFKSTDLFSTDVQSITATSVPSTKFDSSPIIISDKMPMHSTLPTKLESNVFLFTSQPLKTTDTLHLSSLSTDKYQEKSTSFDVASRSFPSIYKSKIFTTLQHTTVDVSNSSSKFSLPLSIQTTSSPKTSTRRHRTRKPKVNTWQKAPASTIALPTTSIATSYQTTFNQDYELATSTQLSTDTSERTIFEPEQTFIIKPSFIQNDSTTILSNDILSQLFRNTSTSTNSSTERFIYFNLVDLPPSSWDLSLNSNESFVLDLVLPSSANSNATSNLTFTNIEATSLSTKIVGAPINLQVDRVQTKHFSLAVNATDSGSNRNRTKSSVSDVIIGHVRSEKFELNFTKTDNMNVRVQQVDSATADLYFDSHFCTNESNLEINLNLSQNGTIRYGDRAPIHIGPVFTRVHMLKQSCDREQPLTLFFDICERQNPCFNGGTCVSIIPNYEDSSYSRLDVGDIGYKCDCSPQTSGEHCQNSEFPSAYCLNGGSLFQLYDRHNKSIEKCICPTGFRGEHCEENIDNCIEITCSSHGICEDGIDKYTCSCFDGFYGINCERKHVQTALLQAASRSFGIVAILLIATIVGLVVASDIHTFLTRKQEAQSIGNKILRVSSELYENSVLLLGFSDAPIELNDLSRVRTWKKSASLKQRQTHRTTRKRKPAGYGQLARRKAVRTTLRSSSQRYLETNQLNQPII